MTEGPNDQGRLLIGDVVLDVGQRIVSRDGERLEMPGLSFRLLHALAIAAPNVLTQEELAERVWPGRVVTPETLTQRVKLVRQALGDDAQNPRYIGLVRGEGYRLLAPVHQLPDSDQRPARLFARELGRRNILPIAAVYAAAAWGLSLGVAAIGETISDMPPWLPILLAAVLTAGFPIVVWLAWRHNEVHELARPWSNSSEGRLTVGLALLVLAGATAGISALIYPASKPPVNDVAVMPLRDVGSGPTNEALRSGIPDQLRNQLSEGLGLRVVARASSESLANDGLSPTQIAGHLDVATLVTGTIEDIGGISKISIELVNALTGTRMWHGDYTIEPGGLLVTQQQIFDNVSELLLPQQAAGTRQTPLPTNSENAYSFLLLANEDYQDVLDQSVIDRELLHAAIEKYRLATLEDPNSPMLHSLLAAALLYDGQIDAAEKSITRAIGLDTASQSSHVQHTLGLYLHARSDDGVGERYERAIALNPNNVEALADYGMFLWTKAEIAGAREHLERALIGDPNSLVRYEQLGNFYGISGFVAEAADLAKKVEETFKGNAEAFLVIARIQELIGNLDEAIAWTYRARENDPTLESANWRLAELYARIGDQEKAARYDSGPPLSRLYFARRYEDLIDTIANEGDFEAYSSTMLLALARAYAATDQFDRVVPLLRNYGLPEQLQRDSVTTTEIEAGIVLADALHQSGEAGQALEIAEPLIALFSKYVDRHPGSWHAHINLACLYSIAGEQDRSMKLLNEMVEKSGLPWLPRVKDAPCFRKELADDRRYHAIVDRIEERERQLRDRLPDTLSRFGLSEQTSVPAARVKMP